MKKNKLWAVVHWLGELKKIGTEKECKNWAKKSNYNTEAPIYIALPITGLEYSKCDKCSGKGTVLTVK